MIDSSFDPDSFVQLRPPSSIPLGSDGVETDGRQGEKPHGYATAYLANRRHRPVLRQSTDHQAAYVHSSCPVPPQHIVVDTSPRSRLSGSDARVEASTDVGGDKGIISKKSFSFFSGVPIYGLAALGAVSVRVKRGRISGETPENSNMALP